MCVRGAALGLHQWGHLQGPDLPLVAGQGDLFHSLPATYELGVLFSQMKLPGEGVVTKVAVSVELGMRIAVSMVIPLCELKIC